MVVLSKLELTERIQARVTSKKKQKGTKVSSTHLSLHLLISSRISRRWPVVVRGSKFTLLDIAPPDRKIQVSIGALTAARNSRHVKPWVLDPKVLVK